MFCHPITVVNKHHNIAGEYIARGSALGNPFTHMKGTKAEFIVASRDEAVDKYTIWLTDKINQNDISVINQLNHLADIAKQRPLNLVCFCAPQRCHGDVVKRVLCEAINNQS